MTRVYRHKNWLDFSEIALPAGKAVCVGRNYREHIAELGNKPSPEPLLFCKYQNAFCDIRDTIDIPSRFGECHHELELALLIGTPLSYGAKNPIDGIWGYGLALDLTLRDLQANLKESGQPWEKAKAFDGSCPLSPFVPAHRFTKGEPFEFSLVKNGDIVQMAHSHAMIFSIDRLVHAILEFFSLMPGDIVLTGTPAGVSALHDGDRLQVSLFDQWTLATRVNRS